MRGGRRARGTAPRLCRKQSWLSLRPAGAPAASFCARACFRLPRASATQPLGRLWPAMQALVSTWRAALHEPLERSHVHGHVGRDDEVGRGGLEAAVEEGHGVHRLQLIVDALLVRASLLLSEPDHTSGEVAAEQRPLAEGLHGGAGEPRAATQVDRDRVADGAAGRVGRAISLQLVHHLRWDVVAKREQRRLWVKAPPVTAKAAATRPRRR
eukprot:scaffold853_cov57-Phaeocystis_antarctica.AAC.3